MPDDSDDFEADGVRAGRERVNDDTADDDDRTSGDVADDEGQISGDVANDESQISGDAAGESGETDADSLIDQIARGGGVGFVGRIGGKALSMLVQILLTRVLGPAQYGLYVLGQNVASVGRMFADLGLRQGAIRYGSIHYEDEDEKRLAETIVTSVLLSAASGLAMAAFVYAFADPLARVAFDDPDLASVIRLFAFSIPFFILLELAAAYFQAFKLIDRQQLLQNALRPVANLALVGGAFLLGFRLTGAVGAFVLTGVVSSAVGFLLLFGPHDAPLSIDDLTGLRASGRRLLAFSLPMMLIAMSFHLATRTDRLMLGILGTSESVGIYNVAAMVAMQFSLVVSSLIAIFKPIVADVSASGDTERIPELYNTVKKWASYGTLGVFVVVAFFAEPILLVFGSEFTEARVVLYVLPLMYVSGALFGPCGALLTMTGREKIEVVNGLLLVTLNVVLNYLLIPIYGVLGAAIAVVVAGVLTNAVQTAIVYYIYDFHPFDADHLLFVGFFAVVVVGSIALATRLQLLQRSVACAGALLAVGLLFYRQIDDRERELFADVLDSV